MKKMFFSLAVFTAMFLRLVAVAMTLKVAEATVIQNVLMVLTNVKVVIRIGAVILTGLMI